MGIVVDPEIRSLFGEQKFDRRAFVVTSLGAGFALAVLPVSAQTITTPADGLVAGEVKVPTKGGDMVAYRAMPATGGPFPVVLVVQEIFGVNSHIRAVAALLEPGASARAEVALPGGRRARREAEAVVVRV